MPGCAAVNCTNSGKKRFLMKTFPRDPVRRKQWLLKMRRDNWTPTNTSCLCEIHFSSEMWEKTRVDGTRKLKMDAVPTLFSFSVPQKKRKLPATRTPLVSKKFKMTAGQLCNLSDDQPSILDLLSKDMELSVSPTTSTSWNEDPFATNAARETEGKEDLQKKLRLYEKLYMKERKRSLRYKQIGRNLKRQVKILQKDLQSSDQINLVKKMLNPDQFKVLKKNTKKSAGLLKWSQETITKALKLKFSCGNNGYKELFTGDSVNGQIFKNIITAILNKTEEIHLNIISITSDMGSSNQALWKSWGISAGRYSHIKNKIIHPLHDGYICFLADIPHLFKNIKSMFITNKVIKLPHHIVTKYNLPTNEILAVHISDLISHQDSLIFKLAPKLCEEDLLPNHFSKMKVKTSTNVVSHNVSSALKFLAESLKKPCYLKTAWFIDLVEKWFYYMTSRHPTNALSRYNLEVYKETIDFLNEFITIFSVLEVGTKACWKPSQTGVLISTKSVLDLHKYLLEEKGYKFVLTSRFSQDCLENLFSVLRSKQIVPNAVPVKNNLKLISVSQYLKNSSTNSYEEDDREYLSGFLDVIKK